MSSISFIKGTAGWSYQSDFWDELTHILIVFINKVGSLTLVLITGHSYLNKTDKLDDYCLDS